MTKHPLSSFSVPVCEGGASAFCLCPQRACLEAAFGERAVYVAHLCDLITAPFLSLPRSIPRSFLFHVAILPCTVAGETPGASAVWPAGCFSIKIFVGAPCNYSNDKPSTGRASKEDWRREGKKYIGGLKRARMLPPSDGARSSSGSSGNDRRRRRRRRRRPTTATTTPRAPPASTAASALAACLVALILNTTGDSPPTLATAFLNGGAGSSRPACFLHAAATAANTGASCRTRAGLGTNRGANSLPGYAADAAVAAARAPGTSGHNGNVFFARRRACSQLAAAWGAGGRGGGGGGLPLRLGGTREEVSAAPAGGFGCEEGCRRSRGRGRGSLDTMAAEGQDGGSDGDASGIRAAGKMEAATTSSSTGDGAREEAGGVSSERDGLQDDLAKMKLSELKVMYREGGGKPGNLRKAELVERLSERPLPPADVGVASSPEEAGAELSAGTPALVATADKAAPAGERPFASEGAPPVAPMPLLEAEEESPAAPDLLGVLNGGGGAAVGDESADPSTKQHQAPLPLGEERFVPDTSSSAHPGPAAGGGDLLSSGPSAVVAAARARGAAAAAASSKIAASGRFRAMTEARRHTEAVRARAASSNGNNGNNAWAQQLAEEVSQPQQHQRQPQQSENNGASATTTLDGSGSGRGIRDGVMGARGLEGFQKGAQTAPGAAAVAAVAAAEAATTAKYSPRGRSGANGQPDRRQNAGGGAGARGRGRDRRVTDGGAWSVLVDSPVARRSSSRPRRGRMPLAYNPWARGGGRARGENDGMPEEGDVVDAFLADAMMRPSDDREASGDPLFDRWGERGWIGLNWRGVAWRVSFVVPRIDDGVDGIEVVAGSNGLFTQELRSRH